MRTMRQNSGCKEVDSWEHFKKCYQVPDMSKLVGQTKNEEIIAVCQKALVEQSNHVIASEVPYHEELLGSVEG